ILPSTDRPERVDQPETANEEGSLGHAEIVGAAVAHNVEVELEFHFDRVDGRDEARVGRLDRAELGQQQNACIEVLRPKRRHEGTTLRIPRLLEHLGQDRVCMLTPVLRAVRETEMPRDRFEPLAAGPAHRDRVSVDPLALAIFPNARVRHERELHAPLAERLKPPEQILVPHPGQAPVEEHRRRRQNHAAIRVMLILRDGGIADPYRPIAAVTLEVGDDALVERIGRYDAVDRLQLAAVSAHDGENVGDVIFHRAARADAIERLHDEIGVAQPAEAIVPGAAGAGRFWNRGGLRGDDRAGFLEARQLERNRGTDHGILPLERECESADPFLPVVARAVGEFAAGDVEIALERRIGAEHEMDRPRQHERRLAVEIGKRRIGGEADLDVAPAVADVVAAERAQHVRFAMPGGWAEANGDARQSGDRLDDADELRRAKGAPELIEARREVGNANRAALGVAQYRRDHGGVALVGGLRGNATVEQNVGEAFLVVACQQAAKNRFAVEARKAPPHDPRLRIDQRGGAAVADNGKVKALLRSSSVDGLLVHVHRASFLVCLVCLVCAIPMIQRRTSRGASNTPASPCTSRPTEKPMPPNSGSTSNAASSVTSSPMKIGLRAANGACRISSRTAVPLLNEGCLTSTTDLPGRISIAASGNAAQTAFTSSRTA